VAKRTPQCLDHDESHCCEGYFFLLSLTALKERNTAAPCGVECEPDYFKLAVIIIIILERRLQIA